jgi:hypothetical protein
MTRRSMPRTCACTRPATLPLRTPLALALLLAASGAALAQSSPYTVGASQSFTHDDNVGRVANGAVKTSDTISTTSLFAGVNQPFGRQRFYANANVNVNRYGTRTSLNNNGYNLSTGLDWSTIERLSGTVTLATTRQTADLTVQDPNTLATSIISNPQTTRNWGATVRYGLTPDVALVGGYQHQGVSYANTNLAGRDSTLNAVNAGLRWGSGNRLTLGTGLRFTRSGQAAFNTTPANTTQRRDLDLDATYIPTGFSTINSRLSLTHTSNSSTTSSNLSGLTGNIGWNYKPTGKLGFNTSLSRDLGTTTTYVATSNGTAQVDANRLSTSFQLGTTYEFSPKLGFNAALSRVSGELASGAGKDTSNTLTVGANYSPTRTVGLGCNMAHSTRDAGATFKSAYNTLGCSARFMLQ